MFGIFFMEKLWPLKFRVRILGLPRILLVKADFVFLIESTDNSKEYYFPKFVYVNYVRVGTRSSLQYFIWLK